MILYSIPPSGNCQKVRIALRLLDLPFEERSLTGGIHKEPPFTSLNPLGQVPVLVDGTLVIRDSQAILVYLAARFAPGEWDGRNPAERAQIAQWLSFAANEIANGPNQLRRSLRFGVAIDTAACIKLTNRILSFVESVLENKQWLEGDRLTIADLACAPYLALAPEGGVDLLPYPNLRLWLDRISSLPRFPTIHGWGPANPVLA